MGASAEDIAMFGDEPPPKQAPGLSGKFGITGKYPGLVEGGNIDLTNRPDVANADGSHSSVRSMSFEDKGREILVPTVSEDGRIMSDDEAIAQYRKTGRHLGKFLNPDAATAYAEALHNQQAAAMPSTRQSASADDIAMFASPSVDAGPEARHKMFGRPKMPEPKTDEELGIAGTPLFGDISGSPTRTQLAKNAPGTDAYAAHHAGDEMHDPIAQMITGGAMAAPLAAVAGGAAPAALGPMVSGAVSGGQQAAMFGQNPLTGALLGAIPGIPKAAGAADRAIGEAALNRATSPDFGAGPGPIAKAAGKLTGMAVGGATHGPLGILVGHDLGGRTANLFSKAGDAATSALARRFMAQEANLAAPNLVELAPPPPPLPAPARAPLAPLVPQPRLLPTVPNGAFGSPFLDEISGQPVTQAGQGGFLPGEAATAVGKAPRRLSIQDASGRDLLASPAESPSLRADTIRDARKFLSEPYSTEPSYQGYVSPEEASSTRPRVLYPNDKGASLGPTGKVSAERWRGVSEGPDAPPASLESQLERSVRMLSELKSAARAGKATPAMVQEAIQAGMSPHAVAKAVGRETFERATQ